MTNLFMVKYLLYSYVFTISIVNLKYEDKLIRNKLVAITD